MERGLKAAGEQIKCSEKNKKFNKKEQNLTTISEKNFPKLTFAELNSSVTLQLSLYVT